MLNCKQNAFIEGFLSNLARTMLAGERAGRATLGPIDLLGMGQRVLPCTCKASAFYRGRNP